MSKHRFIELWVYKKFDDMDTTVHRRESDKFVAFREVFDIFTTCCIENYAPGTHATNDKQLLVVLGKMFIPCLYEVKTSEVWNENLDNGRCGQVVCLESTG
jgi:hypothetical protein